MKIFTKGVRFLILSVAVSLVFFKEQASAMMAVLLFVLLIGMAINAVAKNHTKLKWQWSRLKTTAERKRNAKHFRYCAEPEQDVQMQSAAVRHLNCRITDRIQAVYPNATWEWVSSNSSVIAVNGGVGRIRVMSADNYDFADVAVNTMSKLRLTLLQTMELEPPRATKIVPQTMDGEAQTDNTDVEAWVDLIGQKALYGLSATLAEKGYHSLEIGVDGIVYAVSESTREPQMKLAEMPSPEYWTKLCELLTDEERCMTVTADTLTMTW